MNCVNCGEYVFPHERSASFQSQAVHMECAFRMVAGSLAHIEHRCACYVPDSDDSDPPDMTRREAARASLARYRELYPHTAM